MAEYFTVDELAERLKLHRRTIIRMIERGELEGAIQAGQQYRIPVEAIEKLQVKK